MVVGEKSPPSGQSGSTLRACRGSRSDHEQPFHNPNKGRVADDTPEMCWPLRYYPASRLLSDGRMCGRNLAAAFRQKHMEVRGQRLGVKLPHHQCDLTSMVSGMVGKM